MNFGRSLLATCLSVLTFGLPLYAAPVKGSVVGFDKKPIPGAQVFVFSAAAAKPIKVETVADGSWTVELPDPKADAGVATGMGPDFLGALVIAPAVGFGLKMGNIGAPLDIELSEPTSIGGTLQDSKGAPVAGGEVTLNGFYSALPGEPTQTESKIPFAVLNETPIPSFTTRSDANGQWRLEGIPKGMKVGVMAADQRYGLASTDVMAGKQDTVLKFIPAATVKGRVVFPDGKPAPNFQISSGAVAQLLKTDAEGRFTFPLLPEGNFWFSVTDEKKEWLADGQTINGLTAGEVRDIGDIKLSQGIKLLGQVVDEKGKGIPDANVNGSFGSVKSKPDGKFELRAVPGQSWISVNKAGYLNATDGNSEIGISVKISPQETEHTLTPLKLQRGVYVTGVALDEAGQPAQGLQLTKTTNSYDGALALVGKDGAFRLGPLAPGKEVVLHATGNWDIVGEVKFKAPTPALEAATAPLKITVKKIELATVTARVVLPDGKPVAGIAVNLRIYDNAGKDSWIISAATTDEKGALSFSGVRPEQSPGFDSVRSDDFALVHLNEATRDGNNWTLGDITVSPLDAQAQGVIVDAAGAPVPGAKVMVAGRFPLGIVEAGQDGHFAISKLPRGEVVLLAAKDHAFTRQTVKTNEETKLQLVNRPTPSQADGEKLLTDATSGFSGLMTAHVVPPLDPNLALAALRKAGGAPDPAAVAVVIAGVAERDPQLAATWGLAQWNKLPAANHTLKSGTTLALGILPTNRDFAVTWLAQARGKIEPNDFSPEAAENYFALAGLAKALGDKSAASLLDLGMTALDRATDPEKRPELLKEAGRAVGTSPQLVEQLTLELEAKDLIPALAGAIKTLAPLDLPAAQKLLVRLNAALKDLAVAAADAKITADRQNGGNWLNTTSEWATGASEPIALVQAGQPGTAALDTAAQMDSDYQRNRTRLKIAHLYLKQERTDDALKAMRAFAQEQSLEENTTPAGARLAWTLDKPLGTTLFDREYKRIFDTADYGGDYRPGGAIYAFYHAPIDSGLSRLILENEWDWRQAVAKKGKIANDNFSWWVKPIVTAMGSLDLPRALEMLASIDKPYYSNDIRWDLGLYLATQGQINLFNPELSDDY